MSKACTRFTPGGCYQGVTVLLAAVCQEESIFENKTKIASSKF